MTDVELIHAREYALSLALEFHRKTEGDDSKSIVEDARVFLDFLRA